MSCTDILHSCDFKNTFVFYHRFYYTQLSYAESDIGTTIVYQLMALYNYGGKSYIWMPSIQELYMAPIQIFPTPKINKF